jgi:S1-C subfamily serine protease
LILTNHHVIEGADRIMVRLTDGRNLRARAHRLDPDTDIALIKVDSRAAAVCAARATPMRCAWANG